MAFEACANYGMNEVIGPVSYGGREGAKEGWTKPFSEKTGELLDFEVRKMITNAYDRTRTLLIEHREDVEKVAKLLLDKEVITREDMISLLGKRPFKGKSDDMDKWLDENQGLRDRTPPPPPDETPGPIPDDAPAPAPVVAATRIEGIHRL